MKWHSIKKDLPPDNTEVWAWNGVAVRVASHFQTDPARPGENCIWTDLAGHNLDVTHWMRMTSEGTKAPEHP